MNNKNILKGNYDVTVKPSSQDQQSGADATTGDFERKALERLGGSIAFVVKKQFVWKKDSGKK